MTGSIVPEASWKTASRNNKLGLFADRTSCYRWWPNQFRLLMRRPTEGSGCLLERRTATLPCNPPGHPNLARISRYPTPADGRLPDPRTYL